MLQPLTHVWNMIGCGLVHGEYGIYGCEPFNLELNVSPIFGNLAYYSIGKNYWKSDTFVSEFGYGIVLNQVSQFVLIVN